MSRYKELPSQEYLLECFDYDPETGILTWKERPLHHFKNAKGKNWWNTRFSKKRADTSIVSGYFKVKINFQRYFAHRIIWKLVTGNDPIEEIDHINTIKDDNRWCNLRESTVYENKHNQKKRKTNSSGFKGVYFCKRELKWVSQMCVKGKNLHLGYFDTPEEAYAAYCEAAEKYHGEFKNLG